jgi:tetratricopeptide (TPR) repeat protein
MNSSYRNTPAGMPPPYTANRNPRRPARKSSLWVLWLCLGIAAALVAVLVLGAGGYYYYVNLQYNQAINCIQQQDYKTAVKDLSHVLSFFKDAVRYTTFAQAGQSMQDNKYDEAKKLFGSLGDFNGANLMVQEADYQQGQYLLANGGYPKARVIFAALGSYKDSADMVRLTDYKQAQAWLAGGEFDKARDLFKSLGDYGDCAKMISETGYRQASALLANGEFAKAKELFLSLKDYKDSSQMALQADYEQAMALIKQLDYEKAIKLLSGLAQSNFKDAGDVLQETEYQYAAVLYGKGNLPGAFDQYKQIDAYKDSGSMLITIGGKLFEEAVSLYRQKDYSKAKDELTRISGYAPNADNYLALIDAHGKTAADARKDYKGMKALFGRITAMGTFEDAQALRVSDAFIFFRLEGTWKDTAGKVNMSVYYDPALSEWFIGSLLLDNELYMLKAGGLYFKYNNQWVIGLKMSLQSENSMKLQMIVNGKADKTYTVKRQ